MAMLSGHDLPRGLLEHFPRRGSLFVPPTRPMRHGEMENIKAYVKYSEIFGREPTIEEFEARLQGIGLRSLMATLSRLMTILHVDGVATPGLQVLLRDRALTPAMLERLLRLPDWAERVVFFPQQVLFTMKLAILHAPDRDDPRGDAEFRDPVVELLLMASDFLERIEFSDDPGMAEQTLVASMVRNYLLNMNEQVRYLIPRASLFYLTLPFEAELRHDPDFLDLPATFLAATGFNLTDYLAFGFVIFAWWSSQSYLRGTYDGIHDGINPDTFFAESTMNPAHAERLLRSFTYDYEAAKTAIAARPGNPAHHSYDFRPFLERPLYQAHDKLIVPFHLGYLEARFTNGMFWTISDYLAGAAREQFRRFFGKIFETYVHRTFARAIPDTAPLVRRVFRDFTYPTPKGERKTSDVVLLYPKTAIFLDTTATRIRFEATAVSENITAFDKDIEQIILSNARQLTDRIRDFRAGYYKFGGVSHKEIVRIFPVIVTIHSIPESTPIWDRIRRMLADRRLLTDERVEPLQLIDVEEIEVLEALLAQGVSFLDILEARAADPERRNIGLKNFLIAKYSREGNEFLHKELDKIGAHAKGLFFGRGSPQEASLLSAEGPTLSAGGPTSQGSATADKRDAR